MPRLCIKIYVLILWLSLLGKIHQQTILTPSQATVIENGTLTLTCKSNNKNLSYYAWLRENIAIGIIIINENGSCAPPDLSSGPNKTLYEYECQNRSVLTLTIKRVTSLNHGDGWKCFAENAYSNAVNISVTVPPSDVNINDPSLSIASFVENTTFTFTCTVARTIPEADVTWFYSNRTIDDTAIHQSVSTSSKLNSDRTFVTTSVLSLFGTRSINDENIYCTADAKNGSASYMSRMITLDIWFPPKEAPSIIEVNSGYEYFAIRNKSQTLTCTVLGGNPAPNITWDCTDGEMGETNYSGSGVSRAVTWSAYEDEDCTCTATHVLNAKSTSSVHINVLFGPSTPDLRLMNATVFDKGTVSVIKGLNYKVECYAKSNPQADNYTWTFSNSDKVIYSETLNLTNASDRVIGEYTCEVSNIMVPTVGEILTGFASASLNVDLLYSPTKPNFYYGDLNDSLILNENLVMLRNETIDVKCVSYSRPGPPIYLWNLTSQLLTIGPMENDSSFMCNVSNIMNPIVGETVNGSNESILNVTVLYPPTTPLLYFRSCSDDYQVVEGSINITEGENIMFYCIADSRPSADISWLDKALPGQTFNITNVTRQDAGKYTCSAENRMTTTKDGEIFGYNSSSVAITVLYPPTVGRLGKHVVVEGQSFSVHCPVIDGNPLFDSIKWTNKSNNSTLSTNPKLDFENVTRIQSGFYRCTAFNTMKPSGCPPQTGFNSEYLELEIQYKATVTSITFSGVPVDPIMEINQNDNIEFTCLVDSLPGSNISFALNSKAVAKIQNASELTFKKDGMTCENDSGRYRCSAANMFNTEPDEHYFQINVKCKPRTMPSFHLSKELVRVAGSTAILSLVIVAYPVPNSNDFVWEMYNGSYWDVIESTPERQILVRDGLQSDVIIYRVTDSDFGLYRVTVSNEIGTQQWNFTLLPPQKPTSPFMLRVINETVTSSSATVQWTRGFNGGLPQTFLLEYKHTTSVSWSTVFIEDNLKPILNHTLYELVSGSSYEARIRSRNSIGASNYSSIIEFQTQSPNAAKSDTKLWIVGAVGGGVVVLVVIVVITCRKYKGRHDRNRNEEISMSEKDLNPYAEIGEDIVGSKGYQELINRPTQNSATYTGFDNPGQTSENQPPSVDKKKTKPIVWRKQKGHKVKVTVENPRGSYAELSATSSVRREPLAPPDKGEAASRDYLHPVANVVPQGKTKSTKDNGRDISDRSLNETIDKSKASDDYLHPVGGKKTPVKKEMQENNNLKKDACNSGYMDMDVYAKPVKGFPQTKKEDVKRKSEKDSSDEDDRNTKTGDRASYLNLKVAL
ncbi:nephrin-like isoform X2 [Mya arenaria]|uniref:nephrin-like isoform X2 n=1 Tax=Mya arenaria TaxID=6604 RepID=UPI0022E97050|nr:nephrin-like isoform X2 [Mya arenaria]